MKKLVLILTIFSVMLSANEEKKILVFGGKNGWIGKQIVEQVELAGHTAIAATSRLENREEIDRELKEINPDFIINCAGVTGVPNVDWCEDHKTETLRTNVIGTLNLIDVAYLHNLHVTNFSSGCIYEYDENHPMNSGIGFKETEKPNFDGSHYSTTKGLFEQLVHYYPNVLNLRVRMPVTSANHRKNFITKIAKYEYVINIPNSMTILEDLLPIAVDMTLKEYKGVFNFVNPGVISHNEILNLYVKYIDSSFTYSNMSIEQQNKILKSKRSNNELNIDKLLNLYPDIPHVKESIHKVFSEMLENMDIINPI